MELLSWVVAWSLRNRAIVIAATVLLVLSGIWAARRLPIDAVPDVTTIQVQVLTAAPALSPLEIEQYVSIPVERAMQGLPDAVEVRSMSKYGVSIVTVVFDDGTDIYFARQLVNERMPEARSNIPQGYGVPEIGPITTGLGEIYQFTLRNPAMNLMELKELLHWYIGPQLRSVPGVVEINAMGGGDREYHIVLDPALLRASGLSIDHVVDALRKSNANRGGGYIERNREQIVIGTDGLVTNLEDLRKVVLGATPQGVPITVSTIGSVEFGTRLRRGAVTKDAQGEVVAGVALMLMGENPRTVTDAIKSKLEELQPTLPQGTVIEAFYDRTRLVDRTIDTAVTNLVEGSLLVIVVLLLLLGDIRAGLIVATVIPLSMLVALIAMQALGISGNLMSLGALDFGIIVDGAVIVVENASRRMGERRADLGRPLSDAERIDVVGKATLEVRRITVYGELIIAIVYLPILALGGTEGKLFRPMVSTVLFALAGAFLLSLTLVPVLASLLLRPSAHRRETLLFRLAQRAYAPVLAFSLRRRKLVLGVGVLLLIGAGLLARTLGAEFVPRLDEGDILIEGRRLPGVALSESVAQDLRLQRALQPIPEIIEVVNKTGSPDLANDPMGIGDTDVYIRLTEREAWRPGLAKADLAAEIREAVERAVPEIQPSMSQPIEMRTNELVGGVRSDVGISLYGSDLDKLASYAARVVALLAGIDGIVDARAERITGLDYLRVVPDREKLVRYGLTVADVNLATETMAVGHDAGEVLEGDRRFTIRVKMDAATRASNEALADIPLRAMSDHIVPLGDVADLKTIRGPAQINRQGQARRVLVEFNVQGRDLVSVVNEAQRVLDRDLRLPPGYRLEWGGSFRHYEEALQRLAIVVPLALASIAFLLWSAFSQVRAAGLILLTVPFAVIGGIAGLWIRDIPFSISAGVGFVALFGVAVLNGLVLVSVARSQQGDSPSAAIRFAAQSRLRPVLMTALTDTLGFVPMAISTAPGSEVQRPLATVVIGGVLTATMLTLVLLPAAYASFAKRT